MAAEDEDGRSRCAWATGPWLAPYHDEEWGVPVHDDIKHFEFLILEAAQAGLSWLTVLRRRDGYRRAFLDFDAERVARFGEPQVAELLQDPGIIRNRAKVEATVANARAVLALRESGTTFDDYLWGFVDGEPVLNRWRGTAEVPAKTELSERVSKDLRSRGFRFVGPVVVYAHLQAAGLVNDHLVSCFRWSELTGAPAP
ncbi:MAG: DNA-3-methyladenine glycosylase I [Acidimicrobiales bacterium]